MPHASKPKTVTDFDECRLTKAADTFNLGSSCVPTSGVPKLTSTGSSSWMEEFSGASIDATGIAILKFILR
jgi:hypothetical protein